MLQFDCYNYGQVRFYILKMNWIALKRRNFAQVNMIRDKCNLTLNAIENYILLFTFIPLDEGCFCTQLSFIFGHSGMEMELATSI